MDFLNESGHGAHDTDDDTAARILGIAFLEPMQYRTKVISISMFLTTAQKFSPSIT